MLKSIQTQFLSFSCEIFQNIFEYESTEHSIRKKKHTVYDALKKTSWHLFFS